MAKLRVHNFAMSLDGYTAGPAQSLERPMGVGGMQLHQWVFATRHGQAMIGNEDAGETGIDDDFIAAGTEGIGATIMGRNMFGPVRGPWPTDPSDPLTEWQGWWEDEPPFHHDVFVHTHYVRPPLPVGETTFHFVDEEPAVVLDRALEAADGLDVRLGGGASTLAQYMAAGLVDELHVAVVPVQLGAGERPFDGSVADGYQVVEVVRSPAVTHVRLTRRDAARLAGADRQG